MFLKGYKWGKQLAKRRGRKRRAVGGMAMGIRKELMEKGQEIKTGREGLMEERMREGREEWRIIHGTWRIWKNGWRKRKWDDEEL